MIALSIQFKSLLFSFFYGIIFSLLLTFNYKMIYHQFRFYRILVNLFFVIDNVLLYFIILRFLNNGVMHYYFFIALLLGFVVGNNVKFLKRD